MDNMTEMLTRIETKLDIAIARLDDHELRLRTLEGRAGKRWESLIADVIKALAAAAVGFALANI